MYFPWLCITSNCTSAFQAAGKYHQRGRNYVVEDGDIIFFKFNTGGLKKKWEWVCLVLIMVLYIQMAACFVCTHLWLNYLPLSFFLTLNLNSGFMIVFLFTPLYMNHPSTPVRAISALPLVPLVWQFSFLSTIYLIYFFSEVLCALLQRFYCAFYFCYMLKTFQRKLLLLMQWFWVSQQLRVWWQDGKSLTLVASSAGAGWALHLWQGNDF